MSKVLFDKDFKDPAMPAKFAKDYWQIREEIAYMYKLKRRTNDYKEQLDLDKTIKVLRMMLSKHSIIALIQTVQIKNAIEDERKHRYDNHKNKKPLTFDEHEPHK